MADWHIYRGTGEPHAWELPEPPPWRRFQGGPIQQVNRDAEVPVAQQVAATRYRADPQTVELVNSALYLRRPLLVTGPPGTGKSSLAYAVAHELGLGPVLRWPINSRSVLKDGLYSYDAMSRIEEANVGGTHSDRLDPSLFLRLGPLGSALVPYERPRALLVDEIDKSDIDLPNDLLNVLEDGEFTIPELSRIADAVPEVSIRPFDENDKVLIGNGQVRCRAFPFVVLTSNGERNFPPAFLRRCIQLDLPQPGIERLSEIVEAHLGAEAAANGQDLIERFVYAREHGELATDQLLNAVYLTRYAGTDRERLADRLMRQLNAAF